MVNTVKAMLKKCLVIFQERNLREYNLKENLARPISFLLINKISKPVWRILHDSLMRKKIIGQLCTTPTGLYFTKRPLLTLWPLHYAL